MSRIYREAWVISGFRRRGIVPNKTGEQIRDGLYAVKQHHGIDGIRHFSRRELRYAIHCLRKPDLIVTARNYFIPGSFWYRVGEYAAEQKIPLVRPTIFGFYSDRRLRKALSKINFPESPTVANA